MFLPQLLKKAGAGEKIAALTCYDAAYARILVLAGVDVLLEKPMAASLGEARELAVIADVDAETARTASEVSGCRWTADW